MTEIESQYMDQYKQLDVLCKDCFDSHKGVSTYIDIMTESNEEGRRLVEGWDEDLKELKHLRWMRNKLAHDTDEIDCTMDDVLDVYRWYKRITEAEDPLAELRFANNSKRRGINDESEDGANRWGFVVAAIGVIIGAVFIACSVVLG